MKSVFIRRGAAACAGVFLLAALSSYAQVITSAPDPRSAGSKLELHIDDRGDVEMHGLQVMQVSGKTIYGRLAWGTSFIRWIVLTDAKTVFTKRFDTPASVDDVRVGHYLSVSGSFSGSSDSIVMAARTVKDWSLHKDESSFSGTVLSVDHNAQSLVLKAESGSVVTVSIATSTSVYKGQVPIWITNIAVEDKILDAAGTYNYLTKTLAATRVLVYQNPVFFLPRNFEGKLVSVTATDFPTTLFIDVSGKVYTVYLGVTTDILKRDRSLATLKRFLLGDTVRFYGKIRETDLSAVDAEVVRNISL